MCQDEVFRTQVRPRTTQDKTAYVLVDAMRYEMGQELLEGLGDGFDSALRPAIGQLPTITEVGMAALMPEADAGMELVDVGAGRVGIGVGDTLLKDRASRVKHF
jgi:PglZ domain